MSESSEPTPSTYDERGRRSTGYEVDKHPEYDYEGKIRQKIDEIIRVSDALLTADGVTYDPEKTVLTTTISGDMRTANGVISRLIKVEKRSNRIEFDATQSDMLNMRGISSSLDEDGFRGRLFVRDCEQMQIDVNNPDDVASLLDISEGRISVNASISVAGDFQKLTDIPHVSAPWN